MSPSLPDLPSSRQSVIRFRVFTVLLALACGLVMFSSATAQTSAKKNAAAAAAAEEEAAAFKQYRGVSLGMTADEVRKKLGSPKDKGDEQDFFVFGDNESAQIVYDSTHKVITISADFLSAGASVPTAKLVFGTDV